MKNDIVSAFKEKTEKQFHRIEGMSPMEIEEIVKSYIWKKLNECGVDAVIVDIALTGTRCRGIEKEGSDLDVVVELSTNEREDDLFSFFHEDALCIGGISVDINPITAQRTGSLKRYLPQAEVYLKGIRKDFLMAVKEKG